MQRRLQVERRMLQVKYACLGALGVCALVAPAMGLFAAIPAVIGYNRFSARVEVLMKRYSAFTEEFSGVLYRAAHARGS